MSIGAARIAALEAQLATAPGAARAPILRSLAVEQGAARPELVALLATDTALPAAQLSEALVGARMDSAVALPTPALDFALPSADEDALESLALAEERSLLGRSAGVSGGALFGLAAINTSTRTGYGATVGVRFSRIPTVFLLRPYRVGAFVEGTAVVGTGRDNMAIVGGTADVGLLAGVVLGPVSLDVVGTAGVDGLHQFTDGTGAMPGDPSMPGAGFLGYGATLQLRAKQYAATFDVRRHLRTSDRVPEQWVMEARWAKRWWFIGARASVHQALLDDGMRGPWVVGLQIGALLGGQDIRSGDFISRSQLTR